MQHLENFGAKNPRPGSGGVFFVFREAALSDERHFREAALSDERHQNDEGDDRHQDGKQGAAEVDEVEKLIEGLLFALLVSDRT